MLSQVIYVVIQHVKQQYKKGPMNFAYKVLNPSAQDI